MISIFILSQILAGFALLSDFISFQFKKREHILIPLVFSAAFLSIHFFLLDQITASLVVFLSAVRMFLARKWPSEKLMVGFLLLNAIVLFLTFQQPINFLAFLAISFNTYGNFRKDDHSMRLLMMLGTSLWIVHNIVVWSPIAILVELSFLGSNLIGYYRYYHRHHS